MNYYYNQLKALIKRNILLKKVTKARTFFEIFLPILMVGITYFVNRVSETKVYKDIKPTETEDIVNNFKQFSSSLQNESKIPTIGIILPKSNNDNAIIDKIRANEMFKDTPYDFKNFENQDKMNEYNDDYHNLLIAGIVFKDDLFHYTIRVNSTSTPKPTADDIKNYIDGRFESEENGATEADSYSNIFVPIQSAVDQAIIRLKTNDDTITLKPSVGKLGKPKSEYVLTQNSGNLGFYIAVMFIMFVVVITVSLVKEKEDGIKDGLLMAGTHPTLFWLSWLILYIGICFITSLIITIFFYCTKTFSNTNPIIIFLALFLYGLCCCNIGFVLSTFFKRTKTAGTVSSVIILFISYANMALPYISMKIRKLCAIFICQISIGGFIYEIDDMENHFQNLTFSNLFTVNAGYFLLMLLLNCILYFVLAIILDNLLSNEGSRYLFNFSKKSKILDEEIDVTNEKDIQEDYNAKNNEKCMVEVSRVHKIFQKNVTEIEMEDGEEKEVTKSVDYLAVNDVSFKVYQNEIFALLGHNGAGKTTLLNIMVGLLAASQGDIYFDGMSISSNLYKIRRNFGVCPQSNIIFDDLTVGEHIDIYSGIKNTNVDVDELLKEIDLIDQKDKKASKLSGGQKRKLCIGLAIIGDPKYIFLDEPTTGLDPLSRRKIWDLLLKKKEGRVIFLTTHYMDEADILADRKLILTEGKIRCLGTSLYLKNHFNMSYDLSVESADKDAVQEIISRHIKDAVYVPTEDSLTKDGLIKIHTWRLPLASTGNFTTLLDELESHSGSGGLVKKFALSMPTLEELFIRLEDDLDESRENNTNDDNNNNIVINTRESLPTLDNIEKISNWKKISTIIKFRLKIFFHNKSFAASVFLIPILIAAITFGVIKLINQNQLVEFESKEISPKLYDNVLWNVNNMTIPNFSTNLYSTIVNGGNITEYNDQELKEIGKTISNEPYYISSVSGNLLNNEYNLNIHYNDSMTHALPVTMNALSNSILASKNINERITLKSYPFSYGNYTFVTVTSLLIGIYLGAALIVGCSMYGPLIVRERANQLLQQLQLNGVSRINYWISALCTDTPLFIISCTLIIIVGIIFEPDQFLNINVLGIIIITILLWSVATILYQYVISFFFNKETSANSFMQLFNILPAYVGVTVFSIINASYVSYDQYKIFSTPAIIFEIIISLINPPYAIMGILNALFTINFYVKVLKLDSALNLLLRFNSGITPLLITLIIDIVLYYLVLLKLDTMINQTNAKDIHVQDEKTREKNETIIKEGDEDVYKEFLNVKNNYNQFPISTLQLSKEYKTKVKDSNEKKLINEKGDEYQYGDIHKSKYGRNNYVKTAVEDVSFGVNKHECFGLLGPNGAGKSTTLNMVTSTIPQTTGKIYYNGTESHIARLNEISLGYCPQNDTFWKELTIREHIEFFLRIRGFPEEKAKNYTTEYIRCCNLEEHQNKRASKLSGGTKRKLCLLMAISGYPNQILLDEPTAGMDPSTRRYVWNIIKETKRDNNSAVIMTTHSMEEAENLCDRIGILINGRLVCIGSPEHIKMKYGNTYNLEVQSNDINTFHQKIIEEGNLLGTDYKKEEKSFDRINYEITIQKGIGKVFDVMEQCKQSGLITDYSFSQTTLEQVFINFAKLQITNNESGDH